MLLVTLRDSAQRIPSEPQVFEQLESEPWLQCQVTYAYHSISDTTPPIIETSSAIFSGPAGAVVPAGGQVSLEIEVTGNSLVPKVTLFNGAGTATTDSTQSAYTFTYTIQAGNSGPIVYTVEAQDEAGNKASASVSDQTRTAGTKTDVPSCPAWSL